jgi:hypothetical protein
VKLFEDTLPVAPSRIVLTGCVLIVAILLAGGNEKNQVTHGPLPNKLVVDHSREAVRDFTLVPGSVTFVAENSIVALFENRIEGLYAIVLFHAECNLEVCSLQELAAFVFDGRETEGDPEFVTNVTLI